MNNLSPSLLSLHFSDSPLRLLWIKSFFLSLSLLASPRVKLYISFWSWHFSKVNFTRRLLSLQTNLSATDMALARTCVRLCSLSTPACSLRPRARGHCWMLSYRLSTTCPGPSASPRPRETPSRTACWLYAGGGHGTNIIIVSPHSSLLSSITCTPSLP